MRAVGGMGVCSIQFKTILWILYNEMKTTMQTKVNVPAGFGLPGAGARRRSRPTGMIPDRLGVTLFAAALAFSGPARADSLPALIGYAYAFVPPTSGQSGILSATESSSDALAIADGSFLPNPKAEVKVSGTGTFFPGDGPQAAQIVQYNLAVVAPPGALGSTMVPVDVEGSLSYGFGDNSSFLVVGYLEIGDPALPVSYATSFNSICMDDFVNNSDTGCFSDGLVSDPITIISQGYYFAPGADQVVTLLASIDYVGNSPTGSSSGFVTVDPTFSIDPDFLAQNPGYSLEFSDGIGDSPDAPEPATWATMLVGLGGLGAAIRLARHSHRFTRSTQGCAV